jgi:hypothetical protein
MPRYLVERTFNGGLAIPANASGVLACQAVVDGNATHQVTWIHSYVTPDREKTFCIYDGPNPAAIQAAAETNGLPVDSVTEVKVLDPYFYLSEAAS